MIDFLSVHCSGSSATACQMLPLLVLEKRNLLILLEPFSVVSKHFEAVRGVRVENPSAWATVFQVFSTIQGKTTAKPFLSLLLREHMNSYNHVHAPGWYMWPSPGPGPYSKCSKTVEFRCS